MTCQEVELLLYDRLTGRAAPDVCRTVEAHLQQCAHCQAASDEMQRTLAQLETWTVPAPAPDFQARLKTRVTAHLKATPARTETPAEQVSVPRIPGTRPERRGLASLLRRQWFPVVGLALAATLAGVVVVYQGFGPGERQPEQMTRGLQIDLAGTPIVIETQDPDKTLGDLVAIIHSQGGEILRKRPVESGLELTVTIAPQHEQTLLRQLTSVGKVSVPKQGYRDGEGNVLVLLKKVGTFAP